MDGYAYPFGLRPDVAPLGFEGDKESRESTGQARPLPPGEATWSTALSHQRHGRFTGGQIGVDFPAGSALQLHDVGHSPTASESTPEMVDDGRAGSFASHQFRLDAVGGDESNIFTARRFGGREDPNAPPIAELQYVIPPPCNSPKTNATQVQPPAWAGSPP